MVLRGAEELMRSMNEISPSVLAKDSDAVASLGGMEEEAANQERAQRVARAAADKFMANLQQAREDLQQAHKALAQEYLRIKRDELRQAKERADEQAGRLVESIEELRVAERAEAQAQAEAGIESGPYHVPPPPYSKVLQRELNRKLDGTWSAG